MLFSGVTVCNKLYRQQTETIIENDTVVLTDAVIII